MMHDTTCVQSISIFTIILSARKWLHTKHHLHRSHKDNIADIMTKAIQPESQYKLKELLGHTELIEGGVETHDES